MLSRRSFLTSATAAAGLAAAGPAAAQFSRAPIIGPLPELDPEFQATVVEIQPLPAGQIHVVRNSHHLFWTLGGGQAIRYGVALGRDGLAFQGHAYVGRTAEWPSWTPTQDMIDREPNVYAKYEAGMPGGPENPLGARALYLYQDGADTLFRIHGTPQPWTIGSSVSSGCVRMHNEHVKDLYRRATVGTQVFAY